jgi:hypothetical protein
MFLFQVIRGSEAAMPPDRVARAVAGIAAITVT